MGAWWGLVLGLGLFLVWWSWVTPAPAAPEFVAAWRRSMHDRLVQAGLPSVTPATLAALSLVIGAVVGALVWTLTAVPVLAVCFAAIAGGVPPTVVASRARSRARLLRDVWPEVVDTLASGIRAGLSLPEALAHIGQRGPAELREPFDQFGQDFRATGRFHDCLDSLKARLADPVSDRIIETLRITRDVGGTDVGTVLRTLSTFLRDEAHTRGELEARQSWTVNAARLAAAAPWVVLALLAAQPANLHAYRSGTGTVVIIVGAVVTVVAFRLMVRAGRLPIESRVLR